LYGNGSLPAILREAISLFSASAKNENASFQQYAKVAILLVSSSMPTNGHHRPDDVRRRHD
jgi:hypothetical protein